MDFKHQEKNLKKYFSENILKLSLNCLNHIKMIIVPVESKKNKRRIYKKNLQFKKINYNQII